MKGSQYNWFFKGICLMLTFEALTGERMINVALHRPAVQSSTLGSQSAHHAVNGFRRADHVGQHCAKTIQESDPWWRVDLGNIETINSLMITNLDGTVLDGAEIWIGNSETINDQTDRRCDVISGFASLQTIYFPCTAAKGRYVTVRLPGNNKILGLCEVEVYEEEECAYPLANVALKGEATQSMALDSSAFNAIDGRRNSIFSQGSCTHSTVGDIDPWWRVDLKRTYTVIYIKITNRGDCCAERLDGAEIHIGDSLENNGNNNNRRCATISHNRAGKTTTYHCDGGNLSGRYVSVILRGVEKVLILCEVEVYAVPGVQKPLQNMALNKNARGSDPSDNLNGPVSGCLNTALHSGCCSNSFSRGSPWYRVDMSSEHLITAVSIVNRQDCCADRLIGTEVWIENYISTQCGSVSFLESTSVYTFKCTSLYAKTVTIQNVGLLQHLTLCGVEVYSVPVSEPDPTPRGRPDSPTAPPAGPVTTPAPPPAPPTTSLALNDKTVTVVGDRLCWSDALLYCRRHFGDLLTLHSEEEQRQVEQMLRGSPFPLTDLLWIGLRRSVMSATWFWMSGASMQFTNWPHESAPGLQSDLCGGLVNGDQQHWEIQHCQEHLNFICQSEFGEQRRVYFYSSLDDSIQP